MTEVTLGMTAIDKITGFKGVAIGRADYISGCSQILLVPKVDEKGERRTGEWFDIQRLEQEEGTDVVALDNGSTPGCDIAAPQR